MPTISNELDEYLDQYSRGLDASGICTALAVSKKAKNGNIEAADTILLGDHLCCMPCNNALLKPKGARRAKCAQPWIPKRRSLHVSMATWEDIHLKVSKKQEIEKSKRNREAIRTPQKQGNLVVSFISPILKRLNILSDDNELLTPDTAISTLNSDMSIDSTINSAANTQNSAEEIHASPNDDVRIISGTNLDVTAFDESDTGEEILQPSKTNDYPALHKFMIGTDMENEEDKSNLASILFDIDKLMKKNLVTFPRRNRESVKFIPVFFSSYSSSKNFNDAEKKADKIGQSYFRRLFEYLSKSDVPKEAGEPMDPDGVRFILNLIADWYPATTLKFVEDHQLEENFRFDIWETAATMSHASVSEKSWLKIHSILGALRGKWISATRKSMAYFRKRFPAPTFGSMEYIFDEAKNPEKIPYFTFDIPELTSKLIERELEELFRTEPGNSSPSFGYKTCSHDDGVYVLFSSDHGKGASLSVMRCLLESSSERRKMKSADHGTVTFPFCHMECKKDPGEVVKEVAHVLNEGKKTLDKSSLIAVTTDIGKVRCALIPKSASIVSVQKSEFECNDKDPIVTVTYVDSESRLGMLEIDLTGENPRHWVVVKNFETCAIADLLFAFLGQGREYHSSCKCLLCTLTATEWKFNPAATGDLLCDEDLCADNAAIGCSCEATWDFSPWKWIMPPMHMGMGLNNVVYFAMVYEMLTLLDATTEEEVNLRVKLKDLHGKRASLGDEIESNEFITKIRRKELTAERKKISRRKMNKTSSNEVIAECDIEITRIEAERAELKSKKKDLDKAKEKVKEEIKSIKAEISVLVDARKKTKGALDGKFEEVSLELFYFIFSSPCDLFFLVGVLMLLFFVQFLFSFPSCARQQLDHFVKRFYKNIR